MTSADTAPVACVQRIRPSDTGSETRWVLLAVAAVLAASALGVAWQRHLQPSGSVAAHQIALATGLDATEQGLYADLQAVHDEWRADGRRLPPPLPAHWANDGWPPFTDDSTAARRGKRRWALLHLDGRYAYLGETAPDAGGPAATDGRTLLWRLPRPDDGATDHAEHAGFDIWVHVGNARPDSLLKASLVGQGWRQVVNAPHAHEHPPHQFPKNP